MIKEKEVSVVLAATLVPRLKRLGYKLPTHIYRNEIKITTNVKITIKVEHLSKNSHVIITAICNKCGKERKLRYAKYKDLCFKCAAFKIGLALTGEKNGMFGIRGPLHPKWNPNRTDEDKLEGKLRFQSKEAQRWSKAIKEKFDFTCQKCNTRGHRLVSHHVESWHLRIELRLNLSNGICLCESCHKKFHKIYGKKKNDRTQIVEFLGESHG